MQALRIMGAGKITVIEPDAAKRALALKLGAAEVWGDQVSWPQMCDLRGRLMSLQRRPRLTMHVPVYMPEAPSCAWAYQVGRVKYHYR